MITSKYMKTKKALLKSRLDATAVTAVGLRTRKTVGAGIESSPLRLCRGSPKYYAICSESP